VLLFVHCLDLLAASLSSMDNGRGHLVVSERAPQGCAETHYRCPFITESDGWHCPKTYVHRSGIYKHLLIMHSAWPDANATSGYRVLVGDELTERRNKVLRWHICRADKQKLASSESQDSQKRCGASGGGGDIGDAEHTNPTPFEPAAGRNASISTTVGMASCVSGRLSDVETAPGHGGSRQRSKTNHATCESSSGAFIDIRVKGRLQIQSCKLTNWLTVALATPMTSQDSDG
jgi:hypothetical protein